MSPCKKDSLLSSFMQHFMTGKCVIVDKSFKQFLVSFIYLFIFYLLLTDNMVLKQNLIVSTLVFVPFWEGSALCFPPRVLLP